MIDLKGKVAIVTGGCSGIGRRTVNVLRRAGARVACIDVQDEKGHALAQELGENGLYVHADVTSEEQVAAAFARITERFGGIDVLFNNAGAAERLDSDAGRRERVVRRGAAGVAERVVRGEDHQDLHGLLRLSCSRQAA